jgi:hypothetical protein
VSPWKRTRPDTQPAACLLAKPRQLNINLGSDRFAMFNKKRDITATYRFATYTQLVYAILSRPRFQPELRVHGKTMPPVNFGASVDTRIRMPLVTPKVRGHANTYVVFSFESAWTRNNVCGFYFEGSSLMAFGRMTMSSSDTRPRLYDFAA